LKARVEIKDGVAVEADLVGGADQEGNWSPLSFADVPRQTYTEAVLGVYELTRIDLLNDVLIWAYERSAVRYAAVRRSLGEPDPLRFRYREELLGTWQGIYLFEHRRRPHERRIALHVLGD
jgi:hypothetical protein